MTAALSPSTLTLANSVSASALRSPGPTAAHHSGRFSRLGRTSDADSGSGVTLAGSAVRVREIGDAPEALGKHTNEAIRWLAASADADVSAL